MSMVGSRPEDWFYCTLLFYRRELCASMWKHSEINVIPCIGNVSEWVSWKILSCWKLFSLRGYKGGLRTLLVMLEPLSLHTARSEKQMQHKSSVSIGPWSHWVPCLCDMSQGIGQLSVGESWATKSLYTVWQGIRGLQWCPYSSLGSWPYKQPRTCRLDPGAVCPGNHVCAIKRA